MENEASASSDEESARSGGTAAMRSDVTAAEAAAAEAAARARKARTRAKRLHRHAASGPDSRSGRDRSPRWRGRWRLPRWRQLAAGIGVALVCASSAASGSMWWQHRTAAGKRQLAAEFITAARQAAVALMTLDYTKAEERIQRVLDNSTGEFRSRFQQNSAGVGERLGQSKVVTTVDVNGAAVRSMSDNAGVVLVAVQTETTEVNGQPQSESWRMALSLTRDGSQLKLSDVDFVE